MSDPGTEDLSVYDTEFFRRHNLGPNGTAYRLGLFAGMLWKPRSAVDVGCATGNLLRGLLDTGIPPSQLLGIDHPSLLDRISAAGWQADSVPLIGLPLEGVGPGAWATVDVLSALLPPGADDRLGDSDLVVCTEVAEHLPPRQAERLVTFLVELAHPKGRILWSAAIPGQQGTGHIHEQPMEFWEAEFAVHGWAVDLHDTVELLDRVAVAPNEPWYARTRIYRRPP